MIQHQFRGSQRSDSKFLLKLSWRTLMGNARVSWQDLLYSYYPDKDKFPIFQEMMIGSVVVHGYGGMVVVK